jgi:hypothetical protein
LTNKTIANITTITSLLIFASALTQQSYCTGECGDSIMTFLIGWMGVLLDIGHIANALTDFVSGEGFSLRYPIGATFTWLANPAMFLSLMFMRENRKAALGFSLLSTLLMLSFLLFNRIIDNEAGHYNKIVAYKTGYWLWVLSSMTVLVGAIILTLKGKNQEERPITPELAKDGQNNYISTINQ